jgi:hypothetical protein
MAGFWLGWLLHVRPHHSQTINPSGDEPSCQARPKSTHQHKLVRAWTKSIGGQLSEATIASTSERFQREWLVGLLIGTNWNFFFGNKHAEEQIIVE